MATKFNQEKFDESVKRQAVCWKNQADIRAIKLVQKERERQNQMWGEQNHDDFVWQAILVEEVGELAEAILHDRFGGKAAGTMKTELTHVAAVAVQWLEAIERREGETAVSEEAS